MFRSNLISADHFASSPETFQTALTSCGTLGGGVIQISQSFTLTSAVTVPAGTVIVGRGPGVAAITLNSGGITLSGQFAGLEYVYLIGAAGFTGTLVNFAANGCTLRECNIDFSAVSDVSTNIAVNMNLANNRMYRCYMKIGANINKIGIRYQSGAVGPNTDVDTMFY